MYPTPPRYAHRYWLTESTDSAAGRRVTGVMVTVALHALLILAWNMARTVPALPEGDDGAIQWVRIPPFMPRAEPASPIAQEVAPAAIRPAPARVAPPLVTAAPAAAPATPSATPPATPPAAAGAPQAPASPAPAASPMPGAAAILDNARRDVGEIDRALRKERLPTIVLPPDSPQIRLRRGIEHAREMAPPRLWEAPRVVELVNNTGDGARRTRVITGNGTYCLTDRAPTTNVEMIAMHGRQRITTCPSDEAPATQQQWRTARDP